MPPRGCPRCGLYLVRTVVTGVELDQCPRCFGTFFDPGEAGAVLGPASDPQSWAQGAPALPPSGMSLHCCDGHGPMWTYQVPGAQSALPVFACGTCRGLWLDLSVARALAQSPPVTALEGAEGPPPGMASYVFQLLTGMPIEVWNPVRKRPVLVYSLVAALTAIFAVQLYLQNSSPTRDRVMIDAFAVVSAEILSGQGLATLFTHAFLHGSVLHLVGNLYFLWVFGDNVEDTLGRARFTVLYLGAAFAGGLLYALVEHGSTTPMLGASGAISGLLGAYLVLFPQVRVWVVLFFVRFKIRVQWYLAVWAAIQLLSFASNTPGVAWMAHVGGFAVGVLLGLVWRSRAVAQNPQAARI